MLDAELVVVPTGTPRRQWALDPAPAPLYAPAVAAGEAAAASDMPAVFATAEGQPPSRGRGRPTDGFTCAGACCIKTALTVNNHQPHGGWQHAVDPGRPGQCQTDHIPGPGGDIPDPTSAAMWNAHQTSPQLRERGAHLATPDQLQHVCCRWVARAVYGSTGWHNRFEMPECWLHCIAHLCPNANDDPCSWEETEMEGLEDEH